MIISIKIVSGMEITVEVSPTSTILELKEKLDDILQVPPINQKLLLLGRPLNDEQTIDSNTNIKEGTKLNLVIVKPGLRESIHRAFRKHYSDAQSERLTNAFMDDFEAKLKEQSLDDLERLAHNCL